MSKRKTSGPLQPSSPLPLCSRCHIPIGNSLNSLTHPSGTITVPPYWPSGLLSSPSQVHSYLSVPLFLQLSSLLGFKLQLSHFTEMWPEAKVSICLCLKVLMCQIDIIKGPLIMLGHTRPFATLWTVAHQAPLSMEFPRKEYLEWVAISFSRESSQPRDQTHISYVSCIGRWILYHLCHLRSPTHIHLICSL